VSSLRGAGHYALLVHLFNLRRYDATHPFSAQFINQKKVMCIFLEQNGYFATYLLVEQGREKDVDVFNEIEIRVWKDGQAEAVSLRQVHLDKFEEVYKKQHGFEVQQPGIKQEANQFLFNWLQRLNSAVHG
jgi:hypothetical protein